METLAYRKLPRVTALPTPVVGLAGGTVRLSTDDKPYYCDGTQWSDLTATGAGGSATIRQVALDFGVGHVGSKAFSFSAAPASGAYQAFLQA